MHSSHNSPNFTVKGHLFLIDYRTLPTADCNTMIVPEFSISAAAAVLMPLLLFDSAEGQAPTVYNTTEGLTGFQPVRKSCIFNPLSSTHPFSETHITFSVTP